MGKSRPLSGWTWAMASIGAVAFALSVWMAVHALSGAGLIGCGAGSSCDMVLGSRWSMILGFMPVSVPAIGVYLAFLICVLYLDMAEEAMKPMIWTVMIAIAGAVLGSALWFCYVQLFKVHAFCKYCMSAHGCGVLLTIIVMALAHVRSGLSRPRAFGAFAAGLVLAALLALVQLLTVDRYYYEEGSSEDLPVLESGFPLIGSRDAALKLEILFDYQCPHCRQVHDAAREIAAAHDVAFVMCPSPLSPECNPYIPAGEDHFAGSCDYARLALAVWKMAPASFPEYDAWLWTGPGVGEAQARAAEIVGAQRLASYLNGDEPFLTLSRSLELFGRTTFEGKSGIPRIVCGNRWVIPDVSDADALWIVLQEAFLSEETTE